MVVGKLHAGISSETAVDGQDNAGDCGSKLIVGQEQHAAQQLVGVNETTHGSAVQDLAGTSGGSAILVEQQSAVLVGDDEAGSDGVAADAGAGEVMQAKLKRMCQGIREAYGYDRSSETFAWEQYLAESLARK